MGGWIGKRERDRQTDVPLPALYSNWLLPLLARGEAGVRRVGWVAANTTGIVCWCAVGVGGWF